MSVTSDTTNPLTETDTETVVSDYSFAPPPPPQVSIGDGRFAYVKDKRTRDMLQNGWQAVTMTESWHYLKNVKVESFLWSDDPTIKAIGYKMEELGVSHSGTTYAITMRAMEHIAKHGDASYKSFYK